MNLFGAIGALGLGLFLLGPWYLLLAGRSVHEPEFLVGWATALLVGGVASMYYLGASARREREFRESAAFAAQRIAESARQQAELVNEMQEALIGLQTGIIETLAKQLSALTAAEDEPPAA